jgi:transposase
MSTVTIAVDLAKNVFEIAVAGRAGTIKERKRLSRPQFEQFWGTRAPCRVVMEACATSHFWARYLIARGFAVKLLPPHYVKPYRRRSKTDRADCEAILEADRCAGIHPVAIKSEDQQALVALHRVRSQWIATRTARINGMRALLREFGVAVPLGSKRFMNDLHQLLADKKDRLPERVRRTVLSLWDEVRDLEQRIADMEHELAAVARDEPVIQALLQIPLRHPDSDGRLRHSRRHPWLPQRSPARLLVRAHTPRVLVRLPQAPWPHQQAGRPVRAHAAHPRCSLRSERSC